MPYSRPKYPWYLGLLREAVVSLPLVGMVLLILRQGGLWQWLVELQLNLLDVADTGWTAIACIAAAVVATWLVHFLLAKAGWPAKPILGQALFWGFSLPRWLSIPLIAGFVGLGIGLYEYLPMQFTGPRSEVRADDLEAGQRPDSRWLVLRGKAMTENPVTWTKRGQETHRAVCFVSERWQPGEPVAVVVHTSTPSKMPILLRERDIEGVASWTGVPDFERSNFEKMGFHLSPDALYVEIGKSPTRDMSVALIFAGVGVGLIVTVIMVNRIRVAWRKPEKAIIWDWKLGDRCFAQWHGDQSYYAGVVHKIDGRDFTILFDDGQQANVGEDLLAAAEIEVGTRVFGKWQGGPLYYPGKVTKCQGESLHIHYDDGDKEWTTLSMIRIDY